jgi:HlyD family secretion protein
MLMFPMASMAMRSPLQAIWTVVGILTVACTASDTPDAYGTFESPEVVVSSESSGRLLTFDVHEGDTVVAGAIVAVVDTAQLALEREQLVAQQGAAGARTSEVAKQIDVLEVQRDIARRSYERTRRLFDQQAATAQQLDQAEREYRVLGEQIAAAQAQRRSVGQESASTQARVAQIHDRIARSRVTNPRSGTVLATYVERGEFVQPGQPLYRVADLDTLELRAYVSAPQLSALRIGQSAQVSVDRPGGELLTLPGTVTWIASKAEFTPTPVQTRDERTELVYAVKIRVPNRNGALKIGMPADVRFPSPGEPLD